MQLELAQKIADIATDYGYEDIEIRDYRGRGNSNQTTGLVGLSAAETLAMVLENADQFVGDDGFAMFSDLRLATDSMGQSTILY